MARKTLPVDTAQDEEMSVVVLRFRGSGETLRRGMDTVAQAIAALGGAQAVVRNVNGRKQTQLLAPAAEPADVESANSEEDSADVAPEETPDAPRPVRAPAPPRNRANFKFLSDLDLKAGKGGLKEFAARRNPQTENEKYLVASLWLQTEAGLASFTGDHVFTCFRAMEWNILADFMQPIRKMKQKKSYFDSLERGLWKLNEHGLDVARAITNAS